MEIVGKLLFVVILSVGTAYGVIHLVGDEFLSSGLDRNLLEEPETSYEDVDIEEYRKQLSQEYFEYMVDEKSDVDEDKKASDRQIWNNSQTKKRQ